MLWRLPLPASRPRKEHANCEAGQKPNELFVHGVLPLILMGQKDMVGMAQLYTEALPNKQLFRGVNFGAWNCIRVAFQLCCRGSPVESCRGRPKAAL